MSIDVLLMPLSNDRWLGPALTSKKLEQPETRESEGLRDSCENGKGARCFVSVILSYNLKTSW